MAPTPVLLPGESHGPRGLVGCSPRGHWESDTIERLLFHFSLSCIGGGNGSPLPCSCLENPRDGEPGGLLSMGSHRVGHDWSDLACMHALEKALSPHSSPLAWRIPGTGSLVGCRLWGCRVGPDWGDSAAAARIELWLFFFKLDFSPLAHTRKHWTGSASHSVAHTFLYPYRNIYLNEWTNACVNIQVVLFFFISSYEARMYILWRPFWKGKRVKRVMGNVGDTAPQPWPCHKTNPVVFKSHLTLWAHSP